MVINNCTKQYETMPRESKPPNILGDITRETPPFFAVTHNRVFDPV